MIQLRRFLRFPSPDLTAANMFLLALVILGGFAGYNKFPEFSAIESAFSSLENKTIWIIFFMLLNTIFIYTRLCSAYFNQIDAIGGSLALFVLLCILIFILMILIRGAPKDFNELLTYLITVLAGQTSLLLLVQSWFKWTPDLRPLNAAKRSLRKSISVLKGDADWEIRKRTVADANDAVQELMAISKSIRKDVIRDFYAIEQIRKLEDASRHLDALLKSPISSIKDELENFDSNFLK